MKVQKARLPLLPLAHRASCSRAAGAQAGGAAHLLVEEPLLLAQLLSEGLVLDIVEEELGAGNARIPLLQQRSTGRGGVSSSSRGG